MIIVSPEVRSIHCVTVCSLGIIGPDTATNAEAVHKITSVLKVPHIVRRESNSPYLHHLVKESDSYLVQVTNCLLTRTAVTTSK